MDLTVLGGDVLIRLGIIGIVALVGFYCRSIRADNLALAIRVKDLEDRARAVDVRLASGMTANEVRAEIDKALVPIARAQDKQQTAIDSIAKDMHSVHLAIVGKPDRGRT